MKRNKNRVVPAVCLTLMLALSPRATLAQRGVLRIRTGQTHFVTAAEQRLFLDSLIMEDGSTVVLQIPKWEVEALHAVFGTRATIRGVGSTGMSHAGHTQPPVKGKMKSGLPGFSGMSGLEGGPGGAGANLELTLGLDRIGDLLIDVTGGRGGNAGNGGPGQTGGRAHCFFPSKRGGNGGPGGRGGTGGFGGTGGNVVLNYWVPGSSAPSAGAASVSTIPGLRVITKGGAGGAPGHGNKGGAGGKGTSCMFGERANGHSGPGGSEGSVGSTGRPGTLTINHIAKP